MTRLRRGFIICAFTSFHLVCGQSTRNYMPLIPYFKILFSVIICMDQTTSLNFCFYEPLYEVLKCSELFRSAFCQWAEVSSVGRSRDLPLDRPPVVPTPSLASVHLSHLGTGRRAGEGENGRKRINSIDTYAPHTYKIPIPLLEGFQPTGILYKAPRSF